MTHIIEESSNLGLAKKTRQQAQSKDAIDTVSYIQFEDLEVERICHEHDVYTIGDAARVTSIEGWFSNDDGVIKTFNEFKHFTGLKSVEDYAFDCCNSLQSINIPNSVTSIGEGVFCGCGSLQSITIPDSVTIIKEYAFWHCESLQSINIPNSVTSIGEDAFCSCESLQSINIPDNLQEISKPLKDVFGNCPLKTIFIKKTNKFYKRFKLFAKENDIQLVDPAVNESRTNFGLAKRARSQASSKDAVDTVSQIQFEDPEVERVCHEHGVYTIDDAAKVTSIEKWFQKNQKIKKFNELKWFTGLTNIGKEEFCVCKSLQSINIPDSVTSIRYKAFSGCKSLQSITIPDRVTLIESYAFIWCTSLKTSNIPDSVTSIGDDVFFGCSDLEAIYISKRCPVYNKIKEDYPENPEVNESRTNLGLAKKTRQQAQDKDAVDNINIINFEDPEVECICHEHDVYTIGDAAKVTSIKEWFSDEHDIKSFNEFKYFTGLKSVENYAFNWCTSLQSINIPDSVTSIGREAFNWCDSLQFVNIPDSVTIIGEGAFWCCKSLQSINIPNSVTSIGYYVFDKCNLLKTIVISKNCPVYNKIKEEYPDIQLVDHTVNESNLGLAKKTRGKYEGPNLDKALDKVSGIMVKKISLLSMFLRLIDKCDELGIGIESTLKSSSGLKSGQLQVGPLRNNSQIPWIKFCIAKKVEDRSPNLMWANKSIATKYCCLEICSANDFTGYSVGIVFTTNKDYVGTSKRNGTSKSSRFSRGPVMYDSVLNNPNSVSGAVKDDKVMFLPNWVYVPTETGLGDLVNLISELVEVSKTAETKYEKTRMTESSFFSLIEKSLSPERIASQSVDDQYGFQRQGFYHYKFFDAVVEEKKYNGIDLDSKVNESNLGLAKKTRVQAQSKDAVENVSVIPFEDPEVERICHEHGVFTYDDAKNVETIFGWFFSGKDKNIKTFNELKYFTGLEIIPQYEFYDCASLTSITLPDSITYIDKFAFQDCFNLQSINIPDGVEDIRYGAFEDCGSLKTMFISKNCPVYGKIKRAYSDIQLVEPSVNESDLGLAKKTRQQAQGRDAVDNLSQISFEDPEVERICHEHDVYTYGDATKVTSIDEWFTNFNKVTGFPSVVGTYIKTFNEFKYFTGLKSVENYTFYNCITLQSIAIPAGVTSIEKSAFEYCKALEFIDMPDTVTSIGSYAFHWCPSLQSINIPNSVTSIGINAFCHCHLLKSINIPDSVTNIEDYAFNYCKNLQSVNIPNSVTSIGGDIFHECESLQSIVISKDCPVYERIKYFYSEKIVEPSVNESRINLGLAKKSREKFKEDNRNIDQIVEDMTKMSFEEFYEAAKEKTEEFKRTCLASPWALNKSYKIISNLEEYRPDDRMQNNLFLNLYPWGCIEMCTSNNPFEELRDKFRMVFEPVGEPLQAAEYREECMTSEHFNGGIDGIRESEIEGLSSDRRVWYPFNIENLDRAFKWLTMKVEEYVTKLSLEESHLGLAKKTREKASDKEAYVEELAVINWDRFFKIASERLKELGFDFDCVDGKYDVGSDWYVQFKNDDDESVIDSVCIIMRLDESGDPKRFSPRAHFKFKSREWVAMRYPDETEFTEEMTPSNIDKMCKWIENNCPYDTSEIFSVNESSNLGLAKKTIEKVQSKSNEDVAEEIGTMSYMEFWDACWDKLKDFCQKVGQERVYELRRYPSGFDGEEDPDPDNRKYGKDHSWMAIGIMIPNVAWPRFLVCMQSEYSFQDQLKNRFRGEVSWNIKEENNCYTGLCHKFKLCKDTNCTTDKYDGNAYYPFTWHYLEELVKWFESELRYFETQLPER